MTESELLTFLNEQSGDIDVNFQFWLSATFAVLVSFFFAGEKLVGFIRNTLVVLYIASTLLFTARLFLAGASVELARQELEKLDSAMLTANPAINGFVGLLYASIILYGTISTIYVALNSEKIRPKSRDDST